MGLAQPEPRETARKAAQAEAAAVVKTLARVVQVVPVEPLVVAAVVAVEAPIPEALAVAEALAGAACGVGKMRKALIDETGIVVNVIEINEGADYSLPDGHKLVATDTASVGDGYANSTFTQAVVAVEVPKVASDAAFSKNERRAIREQLGLED